LSENEYTALNDLLEDNNAPAGRPGSNAPPTMQEIMASITFQGDFMLYGYVSDRAMTEFQDGERKIVSGAMFSENTQDYVCVISDDLATYNSLSVGDQITLTNPNLGSQRFVFTIIGLYKDTTDNTTTAVDAANDPANIILTSYYVVNDIAERSKDYNDPASVTSVEKMDNGLMAERLLTVSGSVVSPAISSEDEDSESTTDTSTETDEDAEEEDSTAITASTTGIYLFNDIAGYDSFEQAVRDLGLEDKYTVISNDVATYEASLVPLENLKSFATTFLYVILGIGAIVLIALNTFNIRERKYEIGVLTAIGMAKPKVAAQFAVELLIVTFMAIFLGLFSGALASVPITNSLLATQVKQEESQSQQQTENFGREVSAEVSKPKGGDVEGKVAYVSAVTFSTDYVVISKMALIGVLLTAVSGLVTSLFIMRYDPLKILTERD
jgi:putative ABC transport system permease protein